MVFRRATTGLSTIAIRTCFVHALPRERFGAGATQRLPDRLPARRRYTDTRAVPASDVMKLSVAPFGALAAAAPASIRNVGWSIVTGESTGGSVSGAAGGGELLPP